MNYGSTPASKLQVGQEIGYYYAGSHFGSHFGSGFAKVSKINGHGHITLDNGMVFDKHGDERGKGYRHRLINANTLREQHAARDERNRITKLAKELIDTLNGHRSGDGNYHVDEETKQQLLALVNQF